jgi:hypothetical protein
MTAARTTFAAIPVCRDRGPHILVQLLSLLTLHSPYSQEALKMFYFASQTDKTFETRYLLHLVILRIREVSRPDTTIDRIRI